MSGADGRSIADLDWIGLRVLPEASRPPIAPRTATGLALHAMVHLEGIGDGLVGFALDEETERPRCHVGFSSLTVDRARAWRDALEPVAAWSDEPPPPGVGGLTAPWQILAATVRPTDKVPTRRLTNRVIIAVQTPDRRVVAAAMNWILTGAPEELRIGRIKDPKSSARGGALPRTVFCAAGLPTLQLGRFVGNPRFRIFAESGDRGDLFVEWGFALRHAEAMREHLAAAWPGLVMLGGDRAAHVCADWSDGIDALPYVESIAEARWPSESPALWRPIDAGLPRLSLELRLERDHPAEHRAKRANLAAKGVEARRRTLRQRRAEIDEELDLLALEHPESPWALAIPDARRGVLERLAREIPSHRLKHFRFATIEDDGEPVHLVLPAHDPTSGLALDAYLPPWFESAGDRYVREPALAHRQVGDWSVDVYVPATYRLSPRLDWHRLDPDALAALLFDRAQLPDRSTPQSREVAMLVTSDFENPRAIRSRYTIFYADTTPLSRAFISLPSRAPQVISEAVTEGRREAIRAALAAAAEQSVIALDAAFERAAGRLDAEVDALRDAMTEVSDDLDRTRAQLVERRAALDACRSEVRAADGVLRRTAELRRSAVTSVSELADAVAQVLEAAGRDGDAIREAHLDRAHALRRGAVRVVERPLNASTRSLFDAIVALLGELRAAADAGRLSRNRIEAVRTSVEALRAENPLEPSR